MGRKVVMRDREGRGGDRSGKDKEMKSMGTRWEGDEVGRKTR